MEDGAEKYRLHGGTNDRYKWGEKEKNHQCSSTSPVRSSHSQTVEHGNGTLELLLTFSLYLIDISIAIPLPGRTANGFAYKKKKRVALHTSYISLHLLFATCSIYNVEEGLVNLS